MTMRDILYRAKRDWDFCWYDTTPKEVKNKNEWVYGYFTLNSSILANGKAIIENVVEDYKVLEDTVCQYTGINLIEDTSSIELKHTKLFEGDICKLYNHMTSTGNEYGGYTYNDYLGVIAYLQGCFCFMPYKVLRRGGITEVTDIDTFAIPLHSIHNLCNSLKIVGNIIDNPELIKSDEIEL